MGVHYIERVFDELRELSLPVHEGGTALPTVSWLRVRGKSGFGDPSEAIPLPAAFGGTPPLQEGRGNQDNGADIACRQRRMLGA
jgi:hypothetical protein